MDRTGVSPGAQSGERGYQVSPQLSLSARTAGQETLLTLALVTIRTRVHARSAGSGCRRVGVVRALTV